jgi:hypothetical protein
MNQSTPQVGDTVIAVLSPRLMLVVDASGTPVLIAGCGLHAARGETHGHRFTITDVGRAAEAFADCRTAASVSAETRASVYGAPVAEVKV